MAFTLEICWSFGSLLLVEENILLQQAEIGTIDFLSKNACQDFELPGEAQQSKTF